MESQNREGAPSTALFQTRQRRQQTESAEALGLDLNRLRFARYLVAIGRLNEGVPTIVDTSAIASTEELARAA